MNHEGGETISLSDGIKLMIKPIFTGHHSILSKFEINVIFFCRGSVERKPLPALISTNFVLISGMRLTARPYWVLNRFSIQKQTGRQQTDRRMRKRQTEKDKQADVKDANRLTSSFTITRKKIKKKRKNLRTDRQETKRSRWKDGKTAKL